jgi:hypothetical protein
MTSLSPTAHSVENMIPLLHTLSTAKRATVLVALLGALGIAAGFALAASGPPTPTISSHPSSLTTSASASFAFADTQSNVTFVCALDSSAFTACTSPKTYSGLAQGVHTFLVEAKTSSGATSSPASFSWTVVLLPPSVAIASPGNGGSYNAAGWSAGCSAGSGACGTATDLSGVNSVVVSIMQNATGKYWNGSGYTSTTESYQNATISPTLTGADWFYALARPAPDGPYTLHVRATDGLGLQTPSSSPSMSVFTIDTAPPPAPSITAKPANPTNQTSPSFSFTDTEPGVTYLCQLDTGYYSACTSPKGYSAISQGTHTFSVEAKDTASNTSSASSYTWVVDTTPPPAPAFTQKPPDPNDTATSTFAWTDSESGVSFVCSKENGTFQPCSSPLTYDVATTNNGQHQFGVEAVDAAGNISQGAFFSWKVAKGTPANFTISGTVSGQLYPGAPAKPLNLTLSNPNSSSLTVTSLAVSPQSVSAPAATSVHPCTVSDFGGTAYSGSGFTLPPGTNTLQQLGVPQAQWPTVSMPDTHLNQDGCKGATVTFSYQGSAHS